MSKARERVGQIVGQRYELVDVVGSGGQGTVYKAYDRWSQGSVAVKVLGSKAAKEPQVVERLMREQQALVVLKGTSAVQLFDVCRGNNGELCLVMELLTGVDLDQELYSLGQRGERMNLERLVAIFDPIVSTLGVAHSEGILHRDLKPGNIFLLADGGVRLLDFGMARLKRGAPLTAAGTVLGSPSFMAPEAWQGLSDLLDARADVYSLGVILFLVLTGELPLSGTSLQEKFLGATKGERKSLRKLRPDLPGSADEWASRALALDRDQRFESAQALWDDFFRTFRVRRPNQGRLASFWAKAKGAFGVSERPREVNSPQPNPVGFAGHTPPSFVREGLAHTILQREPSSDAEASAPQAVERTLEMETRDLEPLDPPAHGAPRPPVEKPGARKPGAQKPAAEKPAAEKPATEKPAVERTVSITAELVVEPETNQPRPRLPRPDKN